MVIEGTAFALAIAAYFFLMSHEQDWAPRPWQPPGLLAGTLFTLIMLLSEIPNTMIKKAADAYDLRCRPQAAAGDGRRSARCCSSSAASSSIRSTCMWYDNAYGSIIWALLLLHTTHVATDWVDTVVLWALMQTRRTAKTRGGSSIPTRMRSTGASSGCAGSRSMLLIYWVPRLFR